MATAKELLELARSQLGVTEAPAGSNRVKYNTEYYGREVSGEAYLWCCVFQWWLFRHAGAGELFYGGGKTASCSALYEYYRGRGQTVKAEEMKPGDLVFFDFERPGKYNHIGICERVEPGFVTTIDGNTGSGDEANGGMVDRRRRALKYVSAVARPAYLPETEEEDGMKVYRKAEELPGWARGAAEKAAAMGIVKKDPAGAFQIWETNLQPLVWLERLGLLEGK